MTTLPHFIELVEVKSSSIVGEDLDIRCSYGLPELGVFAKINSLVVAIL
jgi:hypothetical protein